MRLLFYINEQSSEGLTYYSIFLKNVLKNSKGNVVVLCETQNNKERLEKLLLINGNQFKIIFGA